MEYVKSINLCDLKNHYKSEMIKRICYIFNYIVENASDNIKNDVFSNFLRIFKIIIENIFNDKYKLYYNIVQI